MSFDDLVSSRREWINGVLAPWCRTAERAELLKAQDEWVDIAGKVDVDATLWDWAWSRFPDLVCEGLAGIDETHPVRITLADGQTKEGFPDARLSEPGQLLLVDTVDGLLSYGPFSIDEIQKVERLE